MNLPSLRFEQFRLARAPGIRDGEGFALTGLAPGVNLVHGPNGSGKTTCVRAMQAALWPGQGDLPRPSLSAQLRLADRVLRIVIDAGDRLPGAPEDATLLPPSPSETRHRYRLALHELLVEQDADFAERIVRESQGGVDLVAAAEALGFTASGQSGRTERTAVRDCRERLRLAVERQRTLADAAQSLPELRERLQACRATAQTRPLAEKALAVVAADEACCQIEAQLAGLPPQCARLRGDERERLDDLRQRVADLESRLVAACETVREAQATLAATGLETANACDAQPLRELRALQRALAQSEADVATLTRDRTQTAERVLRARQRVTGIAPEASIPCPEPIPLEALQEVAREADRLRAAEALLTESRKALEAAGTEPLADPETLRRGIDALSEGLQFIPQAPGIEVRTLWIYAALTAFAGLLLALSGHALGWLLWLPAAFIGVWTIRLHRAARRAAQRGELCRERYAATGLAAPAEWTAVGIRAHLETLVRAWTDALHAREQAIRRRALEDDAQTLERERDALARVRQDVERKLGFALKLDPGWLPLFGENMVLWQRENDALAGIERAIGTLESALTEMRTRLAQALAPLGYPPPDNADVAGQDLDDLEARLRRRDEAVERMTTADNRCRTEYRPALEALHREIAERLAALELTPESEPLLDAWLAKREAWKRLRDELRSHQTLRDTLACELEPQAEWRTLDRPALESRLHEAEDMDRRRDPLTQQISAIERDIENAGRGFDLTDARAALDAAEQRLSQVRERRIDAAVGAALCDWVRTTAIDRARPRVFLGARDRLLAFTRGRLVLELDDHSTPPRFLAREGEVPARPVEQLSSGERVQLLMAVRLAFIEQDERVRVPLWLDEALGVSDDTRANALIDAVLAIAKSGRQVFYFTAQQDEVEKWRARLEGNPQHRMIDFGVVRRLPPDDSPPRRVRAPSPPTVPSPEGMDDFAYGRTLGVPPLSPRMQTLDRLHLWHVLDNPQTLHRLLSLGIESWGALQALIKHGGAGLLETGDPAFQRAQALARAIEQAFAAWRVGRGRPVGRRELGDADCISERFLAPVADLAVEVQGDAAALLRQLDAGAVKGWRKANTALLEAHLLAHGCLDTREPLSSEAIRERVLGATADDLRAGRLSIERVNFILESLNGS